MKIEIMVGNFRSNEEARRFGKVLVGELDVKVDAEIIYQDVYAHQVANGVQAYGFENGLEEEIYRKALEDAFLQSDIWQDDPSYESFEEFLTAVTNMGNSIPDEFGFSHLDEAGQEEILTDLKEWFSYSANHAEYNHCTWEFYEGDTLLNHFPIVF